MNPISKAIIRFFVLFTFLPSTLTPMDELWSARHRGLSGARCAIVADPASIAANPSGMAFLKSIGASFSFTPGMLGLPELKTHTIMGGVPLSFGGIGIGLRRFGFDLYRETSFLAGGGIRINDEMAVGISSEFRRYAIKGYGTQTVVLLNFGAIREVHDILTVSGTIHNALNATLGKKPERIPRVISLGIVVTAVPEFLGTCEVEKSTRDPAFVKAGLEFRPLAYAALRAGFSTNPITWSVGCSVSAGLFAFEYGGTNHDVLGWTHQFELAFRWQE